MLFASIIESVANIVLDYWFIFGGWGLAPMGFNGAAYASVISESLGFLSVGVLIVYKKFGIKYDIPDFFKYSGKLLKEVFYQSFPLMAQYAISIVAWWLFYILINRNYSYQEQAASQTMRNLFGISGVFSWSFGATTNTVLSNVLGQGRKSDFMPVLIRILKISITGMLCFVILVNLVPHWVFALYGQEGEFANVGTSLLRVVTSAMVMLTIGVIWLNAVVATGNNKFVFLTELASIIAYLIYVFYVIEIAHFSIEIAWMSEWLYWSVMFLLSFLYIRNWIKKPA
ncbi:MAG: hypothetical protein IPK46_23245 [Saprospiraceae bacterium]|nr:hypothetical protein [Saprospiraceae bacterium]